MPGYLGHGARTFRFPFLTDGPFLLLPSPRTARCRHSFRVDPFSCPLFFFFPFFPVLGNHLRSLYSWRQQDRGPWAPCAFALCFPFFFSPPPPVNFFFFFFSFRWGLWYCKSRHHPLCRANQVIQLDHAYGHPFFSFPVLDFSPPPLFFFQHRDHALRGHGNGSDGGGDQSNFCWWSIPFFLFSPNDGALGTKKSELRSPRNLTSCPCFDFLFFPPLPPFPPRPIMILFRRRRGADG